MSGAAAPGTSLAPALRALRLTGMLETLETRLAEARSGRLGHAEFLQVLCEDEIARRDAAGMARRLKAARFPTETTFEGFDFSYNAKL
ncbi:MAG TPA: ATP-binding protein, partial [Acidimicrobiales bacterium]|nr:ATP-binding protein [Acidimicrobiales bacterium]